MCWVRFYALLRLLREKITDFLAFVMRLSHKSGTLYIDMTQHIDAEITMNGTQTDATEQNAPMTQDRADQIVGDAEAMLGARQKRSLESKGTRRIPYIDVGIPRGLDDFITSAQTRMQSARAATIAALPMIVVNNSSNFIGATQLVGEVLYFKSNNYKLYNDGWKQTNKLGPLGYVVEPIKNIYGKAFGGVVDNIKNRPKAVFTPSGWMKGVKQLPDLSGAAIRDSKGYTKKLSNFYGARAGLSGSTAMAVALLLPDHNESQEEIDYYTEMQKEAPVKYYGTRLYQALNPLEWGQHKRQFSGLGMTGAGVFSFLSGWRQPKFLEEFKHLKEFDEVVGKKGIQQQKYTKNIPHMIGGLITAFAGMQLMMAVDSQKAWTSYGKTQFLRLTVLPFSIANRFALETIGSTNYLAAQVTFQTKNFVAALIGGAEKKADGTIVDYNAMREEAKEKLFKKKQLGDKDAVSTDRQSSIHQEEAGVTPDTRENTGSENKRDIAQSVVDALENKVASGLPDAKVQLSALKEGLEEAMKTAEDGLENMKEPVEEAAKEVTDLAGQAIQKVTATAEATKNRQAANATPKDTLPSKPVTKVSNVEKSDVLAALTDKALAAV
jgi:hypothetical protein